MEAAVFPVEAQATAFAPMALAHVTPTVIPRSLNDPVGFSPSCLTANHASPTQRASAGER